MRRFFGYLESKAYKMHIRVLCPSTAATRRARPAAGARLKLESLLWRIGSKEDADAVLAPAKRFMPVGVKWSREQLEALPGLCLHDLMLLPIERLRQFFDGSSLASPSPAAGEGRQPGARQLPPTARGRGQGVRARPRPSSCSSKKSPPACATCTTSASATSRSTARAARCRGGEVQRINLTTALGTSLVNTLFVLDEPSIGLHPRDMNRITEAMLRLRDAGNTLVVVEHDPAVMLAADRVIDMGPGPGARGGQIVFDGSTDAAARCRHADRRSTWAGASRSAWASSAW